MAFNYKGEGKQVKKKILLIPVALLLAISLVAIGCPTPPPEEEVPPPPPEEEVLPPEEEVPPPEEEVLPPEEEVPPPPPETTPGKFEILSHSMSRDKDGVPVVSIQAENTGGSIIGCVKVTVEFLDSAGEFLCSSSIFEYDVAPGQTYDFEIAAPPPLLQDGKPVYSYRQIADYKIEVQVVY